MSQDPAPAASPTATATPVRADDPPAEREAREPRAWWHWMFLYPATAAALLTAVPDWIDKFREVYHDLSGTSMDDALERQRLINKNISCLASPAIWVPNDNMRVDGTICDTGDILIRLATPDGQMALDVFDTARMLAEAPAMLSASAEPFLGRLFSLTAEARQMDPGQIQPPLAEPWITVVPVPSRPAITLAQEEFAITRCQRYLDDRMLLRHVQVGGACFNETLDTYTGMVVKREQVPCTNSCGRS